MEAEGRRPPASVVGRAAALRIAARSSDCIWSWRAAYTWPLLPNRADHIASDPYDPILNTSILWWNAKTIPFSPTWWNPPYFYPTRDVSALTENLQGLTPISTPDLLDHGQSTHDLQPRFLPDVAAVCVHGISLRPVHHASRRCGDPCGRSVRIHAVSAGGARPSPDGGHVLGPAGPARPPRLSGTAHSAGGWRSSAWPGCSSRWRTAT